MYNTIIDKPHGMLKLLKTPLTEMEEDLNSFLFSVLASESESE